MENTFEKLEKVRKLLEEIRAEELMAPFAVGVQILEMVNDLHNDPEQFGAQLEVPSPDGKSQYIIRVFHESRSCCQS